VIDAVDEQLRSWAGAVLGDASFSLDPPKPSPEGRGASFYLLELGPAPPPRNTGRAPLQLALRYLVTTWAETPAAAHALLGELAFAAMEVPDALVDLAPLPPALWAALGVPPRPAFILQLPLRKERPEPRAPFVRVPLVVEDAPLVGLAGVVLGPDDVPVAGAAVELPALGYRTRTAPDGTFRFAAVPATAGRLRLHVRARGREQTVTLDKVGEGPVTVRFDVFES